MDCHLRWLLFGRASGPIDFVQASTLNLPQPRNLPLAEWGSAPGQAFPRDLSLLLPLIAGETREIKLLAACELNRVLLVREILLRFSRSAFANDSPRTSWRWGCTFF